MFRSLSPLRHLLLAAPLAACGGGLAAPEFAWSLSAESLEALAERPADRARVEGLLTDLFGSPAAPDARPLADGTDPDADAFDLLSPRLARAVQVDNERRFVEALEVLDAGRVVGAEVPDLVADRRAAWLEALSSGADPVAVAAAAADELRHWLPAPTRSSSLFVSRCLTCHGPEGGGNGPSAGALSARPPRDFRTGQFLHFADHLRPRPAREELVDVLYEGVAGSSMASYKSLPASELVGLAEHVRRLSARGTVERALVDAITKGETLDAARVEAIYAAAWAPWLAAERSARQEWGDLEERP